MRHRQRGGQGFEREWRSSPASSFQALALVNPQLPQFQRFELQAVVTQWFTDYGDFPLSFNLKWKSLSSDFHFCFIFLPTCSTVILGDGEWDLYRHAIVLRIFVNYLVYWYNLDIHDDNIYHREFVPVYDIFSFCFFPQYLPLPIISLPVLIYNVLFLFYPSFIF